MPGAGCVTGTNDNEAFAGCGVASGSSACGCGVSITLMKWEECDTAFKVVGFVIGKTVNFFVSNGYKLTRNIIQLFRLDKAAHYFFRFMKWTAKKVYSGLCRLYDLAMPLRKLGTWVKDHALVPIAERIHQVWDYFVQFIWDKILSPIGRKIISLFPERQNTDSLEPAKPNPIVKKIGEFFHAIFSGALREGSSEEENGQ